MYYDMKVNKIVHKSDKFCPDLNEWIKRIVTKQMGIPLDVLEILTQLK